MATVGVKGLSDGDIYKLVCLSVCLSRASRMRMHGATWRASR